MKRANSPTAMPRPDANDAAVALAAGDPRIESFIPGKSSST
jgi:hypothetical protein